MAITPFPPVEGSPYAVRICCGVFPDGAEGLPSGLAPRREMTWLVWALTPRSPGFSMLESGTCTSELPCATRRDVPKARETAAVTAKNTRIFIGCPSGSWPLLLCLYRRQNCPWTAHNALAPERLHRLWRNNEL